MRRFRFGLGVGGVQRHAELVEKLRIAEDVGFDVICAPDHISDGLAALPLLAFAADVSTLRVSPMVLANDYRHPVLLAQDCATIDVLSGGRFELGIGTGWIADQYRAAGLPYDRPGVRVDRLAEAVTVIKGCWSGGPFSFSGEHYRTKAVTCPQPAQRPHPPLLIAGSGPRMLRLAAKEASIVGITVTLGMEGFESFGRAVVSSAARIDEQLGWIADAAGDRFDQLELSAVAHLVDGTAGAAGVAAQLAEETGVDRNLAAQSPHLLLGSATEMTDTLVARRERWGISYIVFSSADLDAVAPVVERLAGT